MLAAKIMELEIATEQNNVFKILEDKRLIKYLNGEYILEEGEYIGDEALFDALRLLDELYR